MRAPPPKGSSARVVRQAAKYGTAVTALWMTQYPQTLPLSHQALQRPVRGEELNMNASGPITPLESPASLIQRVEVASGQMTSRNWLSPMFTQLLASWGKLRDILRGLLMSLLLKKEPSLLLNHTL